MQLELAAMQAYATAGDLTFGRQALQTVQQAFRADEQPPQEAMQDMGPEMPMDGMEAAQFGPGYPSPEQPATGADGQLNPYA
jgi:hypothetical protein